MRHIKLTYLTLLAWWPSMGPWPCCHVTLHDAWVVWWRTCSWVAVTRHVLGMASPVEGVSLPTMVAFARPGGSTPICHWGGLLKTYITERRQVIHVLVHQRMWRSDSDEEKREPQLWKEDIGKGGLAKIFDRWCFWPENHIIWEIIAISFSWRMQMHSKTFTEGKVTMT